MRNNKVIKFAAIALLSAFALTACDDDIIAKPTGYGGNSPVVTITDGGKTVDVYNNKFDDITCKDLLDCASSNGIKDASEIIDEVSEAISLWPDLARECGVPQKMIDGIASNFIRL